MRVAFLTLSYNSAMYNSLIRKFVDNGHDVVVITPTYNSKGRFTEENGINILFFKSLPMLNVGIIPKGIANILFPFFSLFGIRKYLKNHCFDLILMTTPPLAFYRLSKYLKNKNKKSLFYLILRDIHPEGAKFIGLDKYKIIYSYFRKQEKKLYLLSDFIGCMSPRNITFIEEKNQYLDKNKLLLLPNWEDFKQYTEPDLSIIKKYNLEEKFIVLYGGNMGIPQGLDIIIDLANEKKHLSDVLFLFVGNGTEREYLEEKSKKLKLNNIKFLDFIPRNDFNEIMKISNIGVISLHKNVPIPNIPSKTLAYFVNKLPILASIDKITDYGDYIIDKSNSGLWSYAENFKDLSSNFDIMYNNFELRSKMGENGYNYLKDNFTTDKTYSKIMKSYNTKHGN